MLQFLYSFNIIYISVLLTSPTCNHKIILHYFDINVKITKIRSSISISRFIVQFV